MTDNIELHDYIKFLKEQVEKSEDVRPKEGFWIGAQSMEITFNTTTEVVKGAGLKMYFFSGDAKKTKKTVQTVKINLVTQNFTNTQVSNIPKQPI